MPGSVRLESVITCPHCAHAVAETMPDDRCVVVYECRSCGALLHPNKGDCCVFCSFGSEKCPPVQVG